MQEMQESIQTALQPWYTALENPAAAQEKVLQRLLSGYARVEYGAQHGATEIGSIGEYRSAFPAVSYAGLQPVLQRVMEGDNAALLSEPVLAWAMTRGTTGKESKYIPVTASDIEERERYGPRALLHYVRRTDRYDVLSGYCLNQTFPSQVGSMQMGARQVFYGYNSGVYARYATQRARLRMVPTQDAIDALGSGLLPEDWDRRFELTYREGKDQPVTMIIGVAQTMLEFGRFCKRRHGIYPKDVWQMGVLVATAIPGIHTKYYPALRALYGDVAVVEMYGATEGIFAQQLDERPYVVPNYDGCFLEVETRRGIVMMHEMRRGERGSLVVSTPILPRYRIGDVVMCYGQPYFRCLARERDFHPIRFGLESFIDGDWESLSLLLR